LTGGEARAFWKAWQMSSKVRKLDKLSSWLERISGAPHVTEHAPMGAMHAVRSGQATVEATRPCVEAMLTTYAVCNVVCARAGLGGGTWMHEGVNCSRTGGEHCLE
jgi:hypothetical protein